MTGKARVGLARRFTRWMIGRARRSRFLPIGIADRLPDEGRLGKPFGQSIMVFFGTTQDSLYQLRPWYQPLASLNAREPIVLVFKDSRTAAAVRAETGLDCVTLATYGQLDDILSRSDVKLTLYTNHDPRNFETLRFTSMVHVYVGHGDSDKGVSVSNQVKAYDVCFVAGQGAVDRIDAQVMAYDARARCWSIGQPQLDGQRPESHSATTVNPRSPDQRRTVLYAPTWEGAQPSVSYGSVATHGVALVQALMPHYRVIYRPHPLAGIHDAGFAAADADIRNLLSETASHRVDAGGVLADSFADADLLICDVSAVSLNWLPTGKPLIVCQPVGAAGLNSSRLMDSVPLLDAGADVCALVQAQFDADLAADARTELVEYYLGDLTPGAATANFIDACTRAMAMRDQQWAAMRARGAVGP